MSETLLIAVDGGGTGCRVAVGTPAHGVLGNARGGPSNVSTNFEAAIDNIMQAVRDALADAGIGDTDLGHGIAHLGLAGADLPKVQDETAARFPFGRTRVTGDRQTMVRGVLGDRDGFVCALGTGTIIARQKGTEMTSVNGWGFQLSDQASGAWLGRNLMVTVLNAEEGIDPASELTRSVAADMGGVHGIFDWSNGARPAQYAEFAPRVFAAAEAGDAVALKLLRDGAAYLERALAALGFEPGAALSLAGGVGPHYAPYLSPDHTANLIEPAGNALDGAFALARDAACG